MALKVGDRVKTLTGEEGQIVALNSDGTTAYVQTDSSGKGTLAHLLLKNLTKIDGDGPSSDQPDPLHT